MCVRCTCSIYMCVLRGMYMYIYVCMHVCVWNVHVHMCVVWYMPVDVDVFTLCGCIYMYL